MSATTPRRRNVRRTVRRAATGLQQRLHLPTRLTRPGIAAAAGVTAVIAAATAAGLLATAGGTPAPAVTASNAALDTSTSGLAAIYKLHPNLGKPVDQLIRDGSLPAPSFAGDHGSVGVPKGVRNLAPTSGASAASHYVPPASYSGAFTPLQLASLALRAGCPASEAPTAAAIAAAESGGNPAAEGDISLMTSTWDWSEGLWQIRGLRSERGTGGLRDSLANADPVTNAAAMVTISDGCTNWTPWSTYTSGAYTAYLPLMGSAVSAAQAYQHRTGALPPIGSAAGPAPVPHPSHARRGHHRAEKRVKRHHHGHATHRSSHHHPARHRHHGGSTPPPSPVPSPHTSSHPPVPTSSAPNPLPSLPLPTKSPTKLPTKTPSLPVPTPTATLPSLPLPTSSLAIP